MGIFSKEYEDLQSIAEQHKGLYAAGDPFPNASFTGVFDEAYLSTILDEFPDLSKKDTVSHNNPREIKYGSRGERFFGPETKSFMNYLNSEPFLDFLQTLTGIEEKLIPDPYFNGGGQHEIKRGGLLKIHADFNKHPKFDLDRRINVLIYLNKDWEESYGGHFELWNGDMTACKKKILPAFNTMAIFSTTDFSYHGHPDPLNCPEDRSRKSLALYYYSNGRPQSEINGHQEMHSTIFKKRDGYEADKKAMSAFNYAKVKDFVVLFIPPVFIKLKQMIFGK